MPAIASDDVPLIPSRPEERERLLRYDPAVSSTVNRKRIHARFWSRARQESRGRGDSADVAAEEAARAGAWAMDEFATRYCDYE